MIYLDDIKKELNDARMAFPNFHSYHEGYAVLKEEVDELWDASNKKRGYSGCGDGFKIFN